MSMSPVKHAMCLPANATEVIEIRVREPRLVFSYSLPTDTWMAPTDTRDGRVGAQPRNGPGRAGNSVGFRNSGGRSGGSCEA